MHLDRVERECLEARREAAAHEAGDALRVEELARPDAAVAVEELHVDAPSVEDQPPAAERPRERAHVDRDRVHDPHRSVARRDLHDHQLRNEPVLGVELRVDGHFFRVVERGQERV